MDKDTLEIFLKKLCADGNFFNRIPRKIVWLSGAPGAGKGTNERYIIEVGHLYPSPLIASSLLNSPEMREKINKGLLLDDSTVISSVFSGLQDPIYEEGLVVDGFPRTHGQAYSIEWLYQELLKHNLQPEFSVMVLLLDEEESVRRQLYRGQRTLEYNARIKKSGQGVLKEVRPTDLDPNIARQRYQVFMKETYTALLTLKDKLPFVSIDAGGNLREVKECVLKAVRTLNTFNTND